MTLPRAPFNFLDLNSLQSKQLVIVVDIEGADFLSSRTVYQTLRYGDPVSYGDPGTVYGGLRPVGLAAGERGQRDLLSLDGSTLTISQRLEPEQGRAALSTLSMAFIDKDQYMTQLCAPGVIVDEILGRNVKIWIGYEQNSFPEDYFVVWRGRITQVNQSPGLCVLQFSDPNVGRRQQVFYAAKTKLASGISSGDTTIPVVANSDFHEKITGPSGAYDTSIKTYCKIGDEFIEYQQAGSEATGFGSNQFVGVLRGARGTTAAAHSGGDEVTAALEISGHAIDIALKLMLSGWAGDFKTGVELQAFVISGDPDVGSVVDGIILPQGVDAVRDYGLSAGDYITVTGATNPANNGARPIVGFLDAFGLPNQIIRVGGSALVAETPTSAVASLRSQYDVFPTSCGVRLSPDEVDVEGHLYYKNTFLGSAENSYRFLITEEESCKEFIESQLWLPLGAYSLTRQGRVSMGLTKPPLADARTVELSLDNVIEPQNIRPQRGVNNRKFFNEISWTWDFDDDGEAVSRLRRLDTESLSLIKLSSVLPIETKGSRTDLGFENIVEKRTRFLLTRYARGALLLTVKTNFGTGNQIEAGDVLILNDSGELQIANPATGERDLGVQLFEVINRSLDMRSGQVSLELLGGIGALVDDRFATIAPSSLVDVGSTTTRVRIKPSFGELFGSAEEQKWTDYIGLKIAVRSFDFTTRYAERTLTGFDPSDAKAMTLDSALPFTPQADDIVDLIPYPDNADPLDQALSKLVHAFWTKSSSVVSGISFTQFTVSPTDAPYFLVGRRVQIHNLDYTQDSGEVLIQGVSGVTITVESMGFTPSPGMIADLVPFLDGGGPYRWI